MMLGGGHRQSKSVLDLLKDPDALRASIELHNQATEARLRSAEDYKQKRDEALETLEQLRKKQVEHDVRHADLDQIKQHLDKVGAELNTKEVELDQKYDELARAQTKLQQQNTEQQQIFKRLTADILEKDEWAIQKHKELDRKLLELSKHDEELKQRERSVAKREALLQDMALKLKG